MYVYLSVENKCSKKVSTFIGKLLLFLNLYMEINKIEVPLGIQIHLTQSQEPSRFC